MNKSKDTTHNTPSDFQSNRLVESSAIYFAAISFIASLPIALFFFRAQGISLFGATGSVGVMASILAVVFAAIGYSVSSYRSGSTTREFVQIGRIHNLLTTAALAFVYSALSFLIVVGAFLIMSDSFKGVQIDQYAASIMVATVSAVVGYVCYLAAAEMNAVKMSSALALFFIVGACISMLSADNPHWWQFHFSSLGAGDSVSSYTFNLTLIIAGAVIVSLSDYISHDFAKLKQKSKQYADAKAQAVRVSVALLGIFLAMVGLFVYTDHPALHNVATGGMALVFILLAGGLPLLVPFFSRAFFGLSYLFIGLIIISAWLWLGLGYFSLTMFELSTAALIFSWLIIFIRHTAATANDQA